jgi:hypothetical protein
MMTDDSEEIAYYRAVEDRFAALRGVPHTLSPKDFQLLRSWWQEAVPLAAVTAGMTEVFARRRERGETDAVVSLSYCRHAVRTHARRLADARVGTASADHLRQEARTDALAELASTLSERASTAGGGSAVADVLRRTAELVRAAAELDDASLDEHLFSLETILLESCWEVLDDALRTEVDAVADAAAATATTEEGRARSRRAARDRELRRRLVLPRLELP